MDPRPTALPQQLKIPQIPPTLCEQRHGRRVTEPRNLTEITMVSVYVLTVLVALLVIYLFYAVINPQKF